MASELIIILLVAGIGYWLFSTGKLDEIFGGVSQMISGQSQQQDVTQENVGGSGENIHEQSTEIENGDVDISGENAGASVNGKCYGDPAQCAKAQRLLEQIS